VITVYGLDWSRYISVYRLDLDWIRFDGDRDVDMPANPRLYVQRFIHTTCIQIDTKWMCICCRHEVGEPPHMNASTNALHIYPVVKPWGEAKRLPGVATSADPARCKAV